MYTWEIFQFPKDAPNGSFIQMFKKTISPPGVLKNPPVVYFHNTKSDSIPGRPLGIELVKPNVYMALCWRAKRRGGHLNLTEDLRTGSFLRYKVRFIARERFPQLMTSDAFEPTANIHI